MKVEVGKYYRTWSGNLVGPMQYDHQFGFFDARLRYERLLTEQWLFYWDEDGYIIGSYGPKGRDYALVEEVEIPEAPAAFVPDTDGPSELPPRIVGQLEMLKALTYMDSYGKLCVRLTSFDSSALPEDTRSTLMDILIQEEVQRRRDEAAKWEVNIRSKLNLGAV